MVISISKEQNYSIAAADYLEKTISAISKTKEKVFIALSGGSTPLPILEEIRKRELNWEQFYFFMVDERTVPINDPDSNFGAISKVFMDHISSKSYSMVQENMTNEGSIFNYLAIMKDLMPHNEAGFPVFDLMLLGMGDDGHTASLFPGTLALDENEKVVVENYVPQLNTSRITLTYPTILSAKELVVLIKGEAKRQIYEDIVAKTGASYPIQKIAFERNDLKWIIQD